MSALTPKEREALNQCVRTLMHLGMQDHVETIASLRDRLDALDDLQRPDGEAMAYIDVGAEGYLDLGTDLPDETLLMLPIGRHWLYTEQPAPAAPRENQK